MRSDRDPLVDASYAASGIFGYDRPVMELDTTLLAQTFVTVLAILDPLGNVPVFLSLVFTAFGQTIIEVLSISIEALQVAGGLLLVLIALELLQPETEGDRTEHTAT